MILQKLSLASDDKTDKVVLNLIEQLTKTNDLTREQLLYLANNITLSTLDVLTTNARSVADKVYGRDVYLRGLIEISNYCIQNCRYCGIRRSISSIDRYRLDREAIMQCVSSGIALGFKTIVMQGGEDQYFDVITLGEVVKEIKQLYPDIAITLSVGELKKEEYEHLYKCGADRYLLRHETATKTHYEHLHPQSMSFENRMDCLKNIKAAGFQAGCGFMVNSPKQTNENLVADFRFIKDFQPSMTGIGPFISHHLTPFKDEENGTIDQVRFCVAVVRLLVPHLLLPATTALSTVDPLGRVKILNAGANVIMPNLSPLDNRHNYTIYDGKVGLDLEAAEAIDKIKTDLAKYNFNINMVVGHVKGGI